jgi:hypothetical protein
MEALIVIILLYIAFCVTAIFNVIKKLDTETKAHAKTFSFHQGMILGSLTKLKEIIKEGKTFH